MPNRIALHHQELAIKPKVNPMGYQLLTGVAARTALYAGYVRGSDRKVAELLAVTEGDHAGATRLNISLTERIHLPIGGLSQRGLAVVTGFVRRKIGFVQQPDDAMRVHPGVPRIGMPNPEEIDLWALGFAANIEAAHRGRLRGSNPLELSLDEAGNIYTALTELALSAEEVDRVVY